MLNCESIQCHTSAYLDREMPLWKIELIRWHLRRCPICAHEVIRLKQTDRILRQFDPVKTSEKFLSSVMNQASEVSASQKLKTSLMRRIWRKFESFMAWPRYSTLRRAPSYTFAVTFALLLMLGTFATLYYPRNLHLSSEVTPLVAQSAVEESNIVWIDIIPTDAPKRYLSVNQQPTPQVSP